MPEPDLIDRCLADLQRHLRHRTDAEAVTAEIEDHLRESAARFVTEGSSWADAQQQALRRFGEAADVRRDLVAQPSGGTVMPTVFTRFAGVCALGAALLWITIPGLMVTSGGISADLSGAGYTVVLAMVWAALILRGVAAVGFVARLGRPTVQTQEVVVCSVLGCVWIATIPWAWYIGGVFIAAAFLVPMLLHRRLFGRPPWGLWGTVMAWPLGLVTVIGLTVGRVGPVDQYGDHPLAAFVGLVVTAGIGSAGLIRLGTWLAVEQRGDRRLAVTT